MKVIKIEVPIQRHALTTGQCKLLEVEMLEFGACYASVVDSILHLRVETHTGPERIEKIKNALIRKTHEIAHELKAQKARQRSYGGHSRR